MDGLEFIVQALGEGLIHPFLKSIGTLLRWPFLFRKYTLKEIYKKPWNTRIGGIAVAVLVCLLLIYKYYF
jgi:hypothetical protein